MKVIFVAESQAEAGYVRLNHERIEEGLRDMLYWPSMPGFAEFAVIAQMRPPTEHELRQLHAALDGGSSIAEISAEHFDALCEEQATRDGRNGVWSP